MTCHNAHRCFLGAYGHLPVKSCNLNVRSSHTPRYIKMSGISPQVITIALRQPCPGIVFQDFDVPYSVNPRLLIINNLGTEPRARSSENGMSPLFWSLAFRSWGYPVAFLFLCNSGHFISLVTCCKLHRRLLVFSQQDARHVTLSFPLRVGLRWTFSFPHW